MPGVGKEVCFGMLSLRVKLALVTLVSLAVAVFVAGNPWGP